jgi:hypothetical protein
MALGSTQLLVYFYILFIIIIGGILVKEVKQSRNRPSVAQRVPGGLG